MTKVLITTSLLDDLADAIAAKSGENTPMTIAEMTDAVEGISTGTDTSDANATASDIRSGKSGYVNGSKVNGSVTSRSSSDLSASGATVTVPAGIYDAQATKTVTSGSATAPATISGTAATVSTGTNTLTLSKTVSVTPTVSAGYVSSGTAGNASVSLTASVNTRSSSDLTVSGDTVTAPAGYYASAATKSVASGMAGTPSATKGTVSNHSVTVTPSVTNTAGYISGGTKTGTGVTVSASELASGNKEITSNGSNIDVVGYSTVSVNVSGGGGKNVQYVMGSASVRTNGYTSTGMSITVAKAGTYKVSWVGWRSSSQGTMGTNLYKNDNAGTNQQTFTSTYGQSITLNNQTYAQGDVLTLYATAGSNSRYMYVANLIIEEQ